MYQLYTLSSKKIDQYYVGHTVDIDDRLKRHNEGRSLSTKRGVPWVLKRLVSFETSSKAVKAEKWIKKMKSRRVIEKVISGELDLKEIVKG